MENNVKKVLIFAAIAVLTACNTPNRVEEIAKNYHQTMYGTQIRGVICTDRDSDMDGYVTCDVSDTSGRIVSLQCPVYQEYGMNCKDSRAKSTQPDN